jgi:phage-related protein
LSNHHTLAGAIEAMERLRTHKGDKHMTLACSECESTDLTETPRWATIRGKRCEWIDYRCNACGYETSDVDEVKTQVAE